MGTGARRAGAGKMPAQPKQKTATATATATATRRSPQPEIAAWKIAQNKPQRPPASTLMYTVQQAAYMLGISVRKTWQLIMRGERGQPGGLASVKIDASRKIMREDVDAFIARQRIA